MTGTRDVKFLRSLVVPIVGDAAIAGPIADGRLLPLLILDTGVRPEVAEVIRVHEHLPGGDAQSQWGFSQENDDDVMLHLRFVQPMDVELILLFDVRRQAILVDAMLTGGGVYLQAGVAGDRLITTMDAQRVLVELPDVGFRPHWEKFLLERTTTVVSQRLGVSRRKARPAAEALIAEMRKVARFQMGAGDNAPPATSGEDRPTQSA